MDGAGSVQRSFRLSASTSALLDHLAETSNESRSSLVERMLAESLRTEHHPLVRFRTGAAGHREPALVGTRVLLRQVVASVRAAEGSVEAAADYLDLPVRTVRGAVAYYAEFAAEVDADIAWAARVEAQEEARAAGERAAFG